jgi:hypothetical protein
MHRASSGSAPKGTDTPTTPKVSSDAVTAAGVAASKSAGAPPLIGKQTIFVERQVARRARARSKRKLIRRLKLLIGLLVLCLIGASMGWIVTSAKVDIVQDQKLTLDADLRRTEKALEEARVRLSQRESELVNLVENRIPGLQELVFNKLIDVNNRYLLNITFAQSGVDAENGIEYHAMLKNETAGVILPDVTIYLFDDFGLQAGITKLEKKDATRTADLAELAPGETRSYHATIEIDRDKPPKYYMIYVQ